MTHSWDESFQIEASAVAAALQCVPPVEADVFEELMDDDTAFFEEMALLSIGRDD